MKFDIDVLLIESFLFNVKKMRKMYKFNIIFKKSDYFVCKFWYVE